MTDAAMPGYPAEELRLAAGRESDGAATLTLAIPGMQCGGCIAKVEATIRALPDIAEARANLTRKSLSVTWRGDDGDGAGVVAALQGIGFDAFPLDAEQAGTRDDAERADMMRRMAVAGFASANVMLLSVSVWSGAEAATRDMLHWISALIAVPAVAYAGRPFFASALRALRVGRLNMDAPISLAVVLAVLVSIAEIVRGGEDAYFDAAVMLLFLLLIGRWLDRMMRDKARSAARALGRMAPRGAWVLEDSGARHYREATDIQPGEWVLLEAGSRLAVDGIVRAGRGIVDAALVTGESRPVSVTEGMTLDAGILSLEATLTVEAIRTADDTSLAEIARLCAAAEDRKSRLARLADKAAAIYAPVVHLIALATFIGWVASGASPREGLLAAVAVLIVTCPCALGLAAPMAQAVASGALFRRGIMLKDGAALERLALVDHVVFDKTGVLTQGMLSVINAESLEETTLRNATSLALYSTHPLATALYRYGEENGFAAVAVDTVVERPGAGLSGIVAGHAARLGSAAHCGLPVQDSQTDIACWYIEEGNLPVEIRFHDRLRDGAPQTVDALTTTGMRTTLLSGDRSDTVADIARLTGIKDARGGLRPEDKIAQVEALQTDGAYVLMVGDGINDAPALSAAAVSIAPSSGSDIGRTAADLVFTGGSLVAVVEAWHIARRTRRVILQNFGLAAAYNAIAIPVAALGFAGPLVAAIAMSSSSLLVTLNALRLNGRTP